MMTDIHKQRNTYEHILEGKHHIWPSFFFPRGETSENRHLHGFFFVLTGTSSGRPSKRLERTS